MSKKDLQQENQELKKKLQIAESWMKKEVRSHIHTITKKHIHEQSSEWYSELISEEMESILTTKIQDFFSETPLYNMPEDFLENIVKSEIGYYILQKWIHIDHLAVTIGYQKCLESIIEYTISEPFRVWASKNISSQKSSNALEDTIKKVIEKKYIFSIGKLYGTLKKTETWVYQESFIKFLWQDITLKNTLLSESFLLQLQHVVESEVFGSKRHTGNISMEEVDAIRLWSIGNLKHKNCLIHTLFSTQSII